jgi:adenosine deaminase
MAMDVSQVAKAELHCHIDGLLDPEMLVELRDLGHDIGVPRDELQRRYPFNSLESWSRDYGEFIEPYLGKELDPLTLMLEQHLRRLKRQRVAYAEIFVSRFLGAREDLGELVAFYRELRRRAETVAQPDLHVELVACIGRSRPEKFERAFVRIAALHKAGVICGVALAGDESGFPVRPLRRYFEQWRDSGMGIEIHAGEMEGPESVRDALENGFPHRLGHGVTLFRDPRVVDLAVERGVHLEFCPTSNLRLGSVSRIEDHPIGKARALGFEFSINTDDPGPFECSMNSEFDLVARTFGFDEAEFDWIYQCSRKAMFAGR